MRPKFPLIMLTAFILVSAHLAHAQQPKNVWRVGVLSAGSSPPGLLEAFRQGLRDLGYVEGRNLAIEWRFAEGRNERLPDLAGELVGLKVDCIFAVNTPAALAAIRFSREPTLRTYRWSSR
jgi:putative ABC transport system substrate-binding protein